MSGLRVVYFRNKLETGDNVVMGRSDECIFMFADNLDQGVRLTL